MEILEKIKSELALFEEKKKSFVKELRKDFPTILKPLFEKSNGKIESIGWTQYTPWFNDGDTCTFGAHTDYLDINGENEDEHNSLDWKIDYFLQGHPEYANLLVENPELDVELYKVVEEFKEVLSQIPDEFYLELFGDHVKVTVHGDGNIEVEEYSHD